MKVGWYQEAATGLGGAELTALTLRQAAPKPVRWSTDPDVWVVHNVNARDHHNLVANWANRPVIKVWHDLAPTMNPELRRWLLDNAISVMCSEHQLTVMDRRYGTVANPIVIPPAINLDPFKAAKRDDRAGTVWIGRMVYGKGIQLAAEWAQTTKTRVKFYGDGPMRPPGGEYVADCGWLAPDQVAGVLGRSERLVFLPTMVEPFGRIVAEAIAAGCQVVANQQVGAREYLKDFARVETAAQDFWQLVAKAANGTSGQDLRPIPSGV